MLSDKDTQTSLSPSRGTSLPPWPSDILDEKRINDQRLEPLSVEEYRQLTQNILQHGIKKPIEIDTEGVIVDGHHRSAIAVHYDIMEDDPRAPHFVVVPSAEGVEETERILRHHYLGRNQQGKSDAVEVYLRQRWAYDTEVGAWIQPAPYREIAERIGVSRRLVNRVANRRLTPIIKADRARVLKRHHRDDEVSIADLAEEVDRSWKTVRRWIEEGVPHQTSNEPLSESMVCQNVNEVNDVVESVQAGRKGRQKGDSDPQSFLENATPDEVGWELYSEGSRLYVAELETIRLLYQFPNSCNPGHSVRVCPRVDFKHVDIERETWDEQDRAIEWLRETAQTMRAAIETQASQVRRQAEDDQSILADWGEP